MTTPESDYAKLEGLMAKLTEGEKTIVALWTALELGFQHPHLVTRDELVKLYIAGMMTYRLETNIAQLEMLREGEVKQPGTLKTGVNVGLAFIAGRLLKKGDQFADLTKALLEKVEKEIEAEIPKENLQ